MWGGKSNKNGAQEKCGHAPHEEREEGNEVEGEVEHNPEDDNQSHFHCNEERENENVDNHRENEQNENYNGQDGNSDNDNGWVLEGSMEMVKVQVMEKGMKIQMILLKILEKMEEMECQLIMS